MVQDFKIIKPSTGFTRIDFKEFWRYRELFFFLAWRNISIRYRQTVLGIAWAGVQPIIVMIIFTIIFGYLAKMPSEGIPYPILTFAGVLPWQFFSESLTQASGSVISSAGMIQKIYYPRLIIPVSSMIASTIDFLIAFIIYIALMIIYQFTPTIHIIAIPLFFVLAFITSLGMGLWFSAWNVAYRDVKIMIPFLLRVGIYISPVGFLSTTISDKYKLIYSLNPMVGVIDGFRWCLIGGNMDLNWTSLSVSIIMSCFLLVTGLYYFKKTEKTFADII